MSSVAILVKDPTRFNNILHFAPAYNTVTTALESFSPIPIKKGSEGALARFIDATGRDANGNATPALQKLLSDMIGVYGGLLVGQALGGVIARVWGVTAPFWFAFAGSAAFVVLLWREFVRIAHADEPSRSADAGTGSDVGHRPDQPVDMV